MLTKRIIPCLDVHDGRVVKGVRFVHLKDAGDPVALASVYNDAGADELTFLDISASREGRASTIEMIERVAHQVFIPFTVGGGIRTVDDISRILRAGADKISLNTAAVTTPDLITEGAHAYGSQCIVVAIDAKKTQDGWRVTTHGGSVCTDLDVCTWAKEVVSRGAGEILLTSMEADGTTQGFDIEITQQVANLVSVPVIASGGAGKKEDFLDVFTQGHADAALAASVFHFGTLSIQEVKSYLSDHHIPIRNILPRSKKFTPLLKRGEGGVIKIKTP